MKAYFMTPDAQPNPLGFAVYKFVLHFGRFCHRHRKCPETGDRLWGLRTRGNRIIVDVRVYVDE